jgi:uncharacterized protein (DUF2147 family)
MCRSTALLLLCLSSGFLSTDPAVAEEPIGEWMVANQAAQIRIDQCAGALWGVISWEKEPGRDIRNPDPAKRNRPLLGVPILLNMKPSAPDRWEGRVYNAEDGRIYPATLTLTGANTLRIEGCVLGILCGAETWTRVRPGLKGLSEPPREAALDVCSRVPDLPGSAHKSGLK